MTGHTRNAAPHRWTPDQWCQAQYAVLVIVFAAAVVLLVTRATALLSG